MTNIAHQITGGGKKEDRKELDFYPTPPDVTISLMDFLLAEDKIDKDIKIWEPACGNGAMSKVFESYGNSVVSTDLRTEGVYGKGGVDFLKESIVCDAIITNPPFNIADLFIKKSVINARIVAMLLKCQYWHAKKRIELFQKHRPSFILPLTWRPDFFGNGGASTLDMAWTVWIKVDEVTKYQQLIRPTSPKLF